jgi:hypothetical protein
MLSLRKVKYLKSYKLFLEFSDGRSGIAPEYLYFKAFENDQKLKPLFDEWGYVA